MDDNQLVSIGNKLRSVRESKGFTGYQLAQKAGITEARLMSFEEGYATPTIATLLKISQALGVSMGFFFQEQAKPKRVEVVRADQRTIVPREMEEGVEELYYTYKSLSPTFPDKSMQPFYIEVELVDIEEVKPAVHPGEEFLFVLEGTIQWKGGDESHTLNQGDAIHFDSGIPHRIVGVGDSKPKVIAVVYQPTN